MKYIGDKNSTNLHSNSYTEKSTENNTGTTLNKKVYHDKHMKKKIII